MKGVKKVPPEDRATGSGSPGELPLEDVDAMDLATPRVLAAIYSAIFDATKMPGRLPNGYISRIVNLYGDRFRIPTNLLPSLKDLVSLVVREDFERAGVFPIGDTEHTVLTLVRWDGPTQTENRALLSAAIEKTRSEKQNLDLFLDDLCNEFLVSGNSRSLPNYQRRLFMALLDRVGDYWEYADLFERIWRDDAVKANTFHQLLNKLHMTTAGIVKPYVHLSPGFERCYVLEGLRAKVKYAAIVVSGTY